jgi:SAM-dependent methyltransferase
MSVGRSLLSVGSNHLPPAVKGRADLLLRHVSPAWRSRRKYSAELEFWEQELVCLADWYEGRSAWLGVPPPPSHEKVIASDHPITNAVLTFFRCRPYYMTHLLVEPDHFAGKRVLEVGCGPMAPVLQFYDCERHGIDPLINLYLDSGWPMYDYEAKFVNAGAEKMPYPDGYFDAVISVNALDHVDDFPRVATEMERVLKSGGEMRFEVEYHEPWLTEPVSLTDAEVLANFRRTTMTKVVERTAQEVYRASGITTSHPDEPMAVWSGKRN